MRDLGALWQYDASPHCFLPHGQHKQILLNMIDDATRYNIGARLYDSENLLSHLDFLDRSFRAHGLPLALYVDYHSFFFTRTPEAFTQLGSALHFYGIALRYASTPQAKGKIERRHQYFQSRLPALFAADRIMNLEPALPQQENRPSPKNAPSCVPPPNVPGGLTSGASKPLSASAMTAKYPSEPCANPLMHPPAPK